MCHSLCVFVRRRDQLATDRLGGRRTTHHRVMDASRMRARCGGHIKHKMMRARAFAERHQHHSTHHIYTIDPRQKGTDPPTTRSIESSRGDGSIGLCQNDGAAHCRLICIEIPFVNALILIFQFSVRPPRGNELPTGTHR